MEEDTNGDRIKHTFNPPGSQLALETIVKRATEKSMQINTAKTKILTLSSSAIECQSYLMDTNSERIQQGDELKMLGFYFSDKPVVQLQVDRLVRKANKRAFTLARYKNYGVCTVKLKLIFFFPLAFPSALTLGT